MNNLQTVKEQLIFDINKRLEDKIIEPTNAELLKKLITNADSTNEAMMIAELGTTYKRTGFHFDKRLEKMGSDIKYLKKNTDLSFNNNDNATTHKLIIGDNYDALQQLLITHRSMIDVIYIDPPYASDSMGNFAETNYTNAITRDNLLSMLYPRLQLARQLLSDNGVIFCSIDDKNYAYVKCLFDEVFTEQNFVGSIIRQVMEGGKSDSAGIAIQHEYCLIYAKEKSFVKMQKKKVEHQDHYTKTDAYFNERGFYYLKPLENGGLGYVASLDYAIEGPDGAAIYPGDYHGDNGYRWVWSKDKYLNALNKGMIEFVQSQKDKSKYKVYYKVYEKVDTDGNPAEKSLPFGSLYLNGFTNRQGINDLKSVFGDRVFSYPKPISFLIELLKMSTNKNSIVLDFFAGSGTTGQATLALNKEDGGTRQFILCTNNEVTDANPNGIAYDVTSKRLKRVMTGECYDGSSDFEWIKKNELLGSSLNVFEIESVNNTEQSNGKSPFDVIDETCYDVPRFESVQEKIIWVCNNFENTQKYLKEEE